MKQKQVAFVATPPPAHWVGNGFHVHNFIPQTEGLDMRSMDPFIMLDYNAKMIVPPSNGKPGGVDVHPHRGFETVTVVYKGRVAHHDSRGHSGIVGPGDVQWMTAASGVLHKEYHEKEWAKEGGEYHMVQLWTNLPKKDKMSEPAYQTILSAEKGKAPLADDSGYVEVISGEYNGVAGPAKTHSPIHLMNLVFEQAGKAEFSFPADYNTALLAVEGGVQVNGEASLPQDALLKFENDGETFTVTSEGPATILVMSGQPLNEPIAPYGPFVMNTRGEIMEAIKDFNEGKFGYLPEGD